jgi:hypothetical protein
MLTYSCHLGDVDAVSVPLITPAGLRFNLDPFFQRMNNLIQNSIHVVCYVPIGIVRLKFSDIAYPPFVIPGSILIRVGPTHFSTQNILANFNGFQHGTI